MHSPNNLNRCYCAACNAERASYTARLEAEQGRAYFAALPTPRANDAGADRAHDSAARRAMERAIAQARG